MDAFPSYQLTFIFNFLICYGSMKSISWWINRNSCSSEVKKRFFLSPYLSVRSLGFKHGRDRALKIRCLTFSFLTFASVCLIREFLINPTMWEIMLISPLIFFFTEALSSIGQIIFLRYPSFPMHRTPYLASSLSHFWGRDWNLWVQDWLRDVSKANKKGHRKRRILFVFLISGLFHEAMVNLPYWLLYGKSYFGTMLGYFCIQALALWIDKKFMIHSPRIVRRIYMWVAIVLPSPLFINVPLLTFFGLRA